MPGRRTIVAAGFLVLGLGAAVLDLALHGEDPETPPPPDASDPGLPGSPQAERRAPSRIVTNKSGSDADPEAANPAGSQADAGTAPSHATSGPEADAEANAEPVRGSVWPVNPDGIRSAMKEATPQIKECYEQWLLVRPDLAGRLELSFDIGVDPDDPGMGRIRDARVVDSTMDATFFQGCVVNVVSDLAFDPPEDGGMTVVYPFVFRTR